MFGISPAVRLQALLAPKKCWRGILSVRPDPAGAQPYLLDATPAPAKQTQKKRPRHMTRAARLKVLQMTLLPCMRAAKTQYCAMLRTVRAPQVFADTGPLRYPFPLFKPNAIVEMKELPASQG